MALPISAWSSDAAVIDGSLTFDEGDLNGFVDGRLEASRAAALSESLATDRDARVRVDGWKRQNDSLRTMFASVLFEPVPLRLLPTSMVAPKSGSPSRASAAQPHRERRASSSPVRPSGLVATTMLGVALVAFAAGALASLGTDDFGLSPRSGRAARFDETYAPSEERDFVSRAVETHQAYLTDPTRPVEITAADEPRLTRWIQHGLAGPLQIPSLQRQGWSLIGGRVVPGQHGPAAFLVYGNGTDRMGLFIARTQAMQGGDPKIVDAGGIDAASIAYWTEGSFSYALTTSRPAEWLERNAEVLHAAISGQRRDFATVP